MNTVAGRATDDAGARELKTWQQPSQLLPLLLGQLDIGRQITVLEVGRARPDTVDFFSQFKCRIHFADLYSAELLSNPPEEISQQQLQKEFRTLFNFPTGTWLNLILFWDFLNYLDTNLLKAFCSAINPYLQQGTLGHGFGMRNAATSLANQEYGIHDLESFNVTRRDTAQLPYFPLPQAKLQEGLSCFTIDRGMLLPDGRQEMLLSAKLASRLKQK